jgi:hypothetical protein
VIALLLLILASGWAGPLVAPVPGADSPDDCAQATPIRAGGVVPPSLFRSDGTAVCTGLVMPPQQVGYLLKLEEYHEASQRLHALDVELLQAERDWYRDKLATQMEPKPWYQRPEGQRWIGRLEMLLVVSVATVGVGYAYNVGR